MTIWFDHIISEFSKLGEAVRSDISALKDRLKGVLPDVFNEASSGEAFHRALGQGPDNPVQFTEEQKGIMQRIMDKLRREEEEEEEAERKAKKKAEQNAGGGEASISENEHAGEDQDHPSEDDQANLAADTVLAQGSHWKGVRDRGAYSQLRLGDLSTEAGKKKAIKKLQRVILQRIAKGETSEIRFYKGSRIDPIATDLAKKAKESLVNGLGDHRALQEAVYRLQIKDTRQDTPEPWKKIMPETRKWIENIFDDRASKKSTKNARKGVESATGPFRFAGRKNLGELEKAMEAREESKAASNASSSPTSPV